MTPREETARIIILVPNECLNDSSRGKCRMIMPQSGIGATPLKGLITEIKDSACHRRTSERHHIKGLYSKVGNKNMPQSDV